MLYFLPSPTVFCLFSCFNGLNLHVEYKSFHYDQTRCKGCNLTKETTYGFEYNIEPWAKFAYRRGSYFSVGYRSITL